MCKYHPPLQISINTLNVYTLSTRPIFFHFTPKYLQLQLVCNKTKDPTRFIISLDLSSFNIYNTIPHLLLVIAVIVSPHVWRLGRRHFYYTYICYLIYNSLAKQRYRKFITNQLIFL